MSAEPPGGIADDQPQLAAPDRLAHKRRARRPAGRRRHPQDAEIGGDGGSWLSSVDRSHPLWRGRDRSGRRRGMQKDEGALLRNARLAHPLEQNIAVCELGGDVVAQDAEAQSRRHPVAGGDKFLHLLDQPEMAAAADQGVVVAAEIRERRNRGPQKGQGLIETPRPQQGQAVDRGVKARKAVEGAHAHRAPGSPRRPHQNGPHG